MAPRPPTLTAAASVRSIIRSLKSFNKSDVESRISFISSSYPWLMLSPRTCNTSYELYSFAENRVLSIPKPDLEIKSGFPEATRILGSSHGWLACYNHYRCGELFLSNPLSGRRVNLPHAHKLSTPDPDPYFDREYWCKKIIMTCSDPESEDCRVAMISQTESRLAFCCPGRSSTEWTVIGSEQAKHYIDFVYSPKHQLFFLLKHPRQIHVWDLKNPLSPSLVWSCNVNDLDVDRDSGGELRMNEEIQYLNDRRDYLVMSKQGDLFYVERFINGSLLPDGSCGDQLDYGSNLRYPSKTVTFDVYKIVRDWGVGKKVLMDGHLNGLVMFLGDPSEGIAIPAKDANGFKPNSICFTNDHGLFSSADSRYGTDNGIFDYKEKELYPCYYPFDYKSLKNKIMPPPLWLTPN